MRHIGAKLWLQENPGNFEVVRRVLGHKSLTTITRSYIEFDDQAAVRLYDNIILDIRKKVEDGHENED
jgi:integrase